jgi:hypothetical protein
LHFSVLQSPDPPPCTLFSSSFLQNFLQVSYWGNMPFAAGLKTLCIPISGGQEKCRALSYSFVYKSHTSPCSPLIYCSQLF